MSLKENNERKREVPQEKIKIVNSLAAKIKQSRTVLIASTHWLPSSQFHEIKKNLRGKADISVVKKSLILRAFSSLQRKGIDELSQHIQADVALFFSALDPFELSALLTDNMSPAKAKGGDIAPEDISVEPGPTNLAAGPAISELSGAGLKVTVEGGKLAIKQPATVVFKGEVIKDNVAGVLAKLNILPMKVGFEPIAAYDSQSEQVYVGIKIDKKQTLAELRDCIGRSLGLAVEIGYPTKETISFLLTRAFMHEKAIERLLNQPIGQGATSPIQDTITKEGS